MARGGNRQAIASLVERFAPMLYRYLIHLTGEASLAEDLLQDTWMKVMEHIDRYKPEYSFKSWLYAIARNCAIDLWRRQSREGRITIHWGDEGDDSPDPLNQIPDHAPLALDQLEEEQAQAMMEKVLPNLPHHYREALILRFHEEMPLEEMAHVLKTPLSTVKTRVRRGLELMRQRLTELEGRPYERT